MHSRLQELSDHLDRERAELRAAVASVPADKHAIAPEGQWSVLGILEHLVLVEGRVAAAMQKQINDARAAGVGPETDATPIIPTLNVGVFTDRTKKLKSPEQVHPKAGRSLTEIWQSLDEMHDAMRALMTSADGMKLTEITMPHPVFGPLHLYRWFAWVGSHEARHAAQIRELGATLGASS